MLWFDRNISVSDRVMIRSSDSNLITTQLINISYPILRISNLSIHLTPPSEERELFKFNKETHLTPILCELTQQSLPNQSG